MSVTNLTPEELKVLQEYQNENNEIVLVKINPAFYRLSEVDLLFGNSNKARDELNWKPTVSFIQLVEKMVKNDITLSNI